MQGTVMKAAWLTLVVAMTSSAQFIDLHEVVRDWNCANQHVTPEDRKQFESIQRDASRGVYGVYETMRDRGCGSSNLETPRIMDKKGDGKIMIDVGLGWDAAETIAAVKNGYQVLAFEMAPAHFRMIKDKTKGDPQIQTVELSQNANGTWNLPDLKQPEAGKGFAYIIHSGLSDLVGTTKLPGGYGNLAMTLGDPGDVPVPILTLDAAVPAWAKSIYFMKVDTQGFEAKIIFGARNLMQAGRFRYVQYEFSPWLMKRLRREFYSDPFQLLSFIPSMRAMCFDMMGEHHSLGRPSDIRTYFTSLDQGLHGYTKGPKDPIGPWDDIMCAFPPVLGEQPVQRSPAAASLARSKLARLRAAPFLGVSNAAAFSAQLRGIKRHGN